MSKKDEIFNEFVNQQKPDIRDWIIDIDTLLTRDCRAIGEIKNEMGKITYISRISNKKVCELYMGIEDCKAFPYGRHFANDDNILACLPESMLDAMVYDNYECTGCASKRPDLVRHSFRFTHKGENYNRCQHKGFGFSLDKAEERKIIEKWIIMELAWS